MALAVMTPPQTTLASSTMRASLVPVTVTEPPWTVACVPTISSGLILPGTTWQVRLEQGIVRLQRFDRGGVDLGEGVIRRSEDRELAAVQGVHQVNLG